MEIRTNQRDSKDFFASLWGPSQRDDRPYRLLVVMPGGGAACAVNAGMLRALSDAGIFPDTIVAVSGSVGTAAGYMCGQIGKVFEAFEYMADGGFIRLNWRLRVKIDLDELVAVLDGRRKHIGFPGIDLQKVFEHPTHFRVPITHWQTGTSYLVEGKSTGFYTYLRAAMSFAGVGQSVAIEENDFGDGAMGMPLPVCTAMIERRPTHVLILGNQPLSTASTFIERYIVPLVMWDNVRDAPRILQTLALAMNHLIVKELERLQRASTPWLAIFPDRKDPDVRQWTAHARTLRHANANAYEFLAGNLEKGLRSRTDL